jgi:putative sigma-54 modulation protein
MDIEIRSHGVKVSDGLRSFVDRRMSKLDRIAEHVIEAHLDLRADDRRNGNGQTIAQLTLRTGRHVLRAEERDQEAAKAIDAAIDKLIRQVRNISDKRSSRRRRGARYDQPAADGLTVSATGADTEVDTVDDELESPVVRIKRFQMKPMMVDEAIDQMELVGHDFFLFRNSDEDELNVLYRRRDGTFGLLAPVRS